MLVHLLLDTDVYSSLPKGYQYQGYALPLIGFSLDLMPSLNAELNSNALHLSLDVALTVFYFLNNQCVADLNNQYGYGNHLDGVINSTVSPHSLLAQMGLGMDYLLGSSFILNTKAGLLWNLSHHQGDFRSHIDYLAHKFKPIFGKC